MEEVFTHRPFPTCWNTEHDANRQQRNEWPTVKRGPGAAAAPAEMEREAARKLLWHQDNSASARMVSAGLARPPQHQQASEASSSLGEGGTPFLSQANLEADAPAEPQCSPLGRVQTDARALHGKNISALRRELPCQASGSLAEGMPPGAAAPLR